MTSENYDLDSLKRELSKFFMQSQIGTVSQKSQKDILYFNKDLFELEKLLLELKEEYKVNTRLDSRIFSDSILNSFSKEAKAFKSIDYSLALLIHLCYQPKHDAEELLKMINDFIGNAKDKFSFQDILITKSGATRCVTNIRFSLKLLRKLGLVYNEDIIENVTRRVVLPTPLGYLISLYVLKNVKRKPSHYLSFKDTMGGYNLPLLETIHTMKYSLNGFFQKIEEMYPNVNELHVVNSKILNEYFALILPYIEITDSKLIINEKGLEKSIQDYYKKIGQYIALSHQLKIIFLKLFKVETIYI